MDYVKQPLAFKVKKVARYVRLYGVARTRIKVLAQLHMRRQLNTLPPRSTKLTARQTVGLIGCGNYAFGNIAYYLRKKHGAVIGAAMDLEPHRAASLAKEYGVPFHTGDADELIALPGIRLIYIASNHASHAEYAIKALQAGKHVYIEKPHVVTEDQLERLVAAMRTYPGKVFLGFNRPGSRFGEIILDRLRGESGSGMYNWFVAGHAIDPDHWYFKPEEGGRVLGNLCHWTDFVLRMAGNSAFPVRINPTRATRSDSDIAVTYVFPDETVAVITFSAKGHTFEGVAERLSAHKGDTLIAMEDYKWMRVDRREEKRMYVNRLRDHGHARNILAAYDSVHKDLPYDRAAEMEHIVNTAWFFLKTREALESSEPMVIDAYPLAPQTAGAGV